MQLRERGGQILGVNVAVRGLLVAGFPAVGRAGRGADEEEFGGVGGVQVLVFWVDGGGLAEVDAGAGAHDGDVVEELADEDCGGGGVEGGDYAAEGFQGREGVQGGGLGEEGADGVEVGGVEDAGVEEVLFGGKGGVSWGGGGRGGGGGVEGLL